MEVVRAGFQADVDDRARLPSIFRGGMFLSVEFLNRIDGQMRSRRARNSFFIGDCCTVIRVVVVGAVDDEIVVFGAIAVGRDGMESAAGSAINAGP